MRNCGKCNNEELNYRIDMIPKDIMVYIRWIDFIYLILFGVTIYLIIKD